MQMLGYLKLQKPQKNSGAESLVDVPKIMAKKGLTFPFYLKLCLAISLISVIVAGGSISWMYARTQRSILEDLSEELKAIGVKETANLTLEDIKAISGLSNQETKASISTNPQILLKDKIAVSGFKSQTEKNKIINSKNYQTIAQKLGDITNRTRRDNKSDVFIWSTYLVTIAPNSSNKKILRVLADDSEYRYAESNANSDPFLGYYYIPGSDSLTQAFSGVAQADRTFYTNQFSSFITAGIPIKDASGKVIAVMGLDMDVRSIAKQLEGLKYTYLHVIVGSFLFSLLVAFLLAQWLVRPIVKLYEGAQKVRDRNFDTVVDIKTNDELQLLAETFNSMVAEMGSYTRTLEDRVTERTRQLNEAKQALEIDLEKGQKLQRDFLPEPLLKLPNWEIAAVFEPAKTVAGDFYDVFMLPGNYVGLVIADVCDKGVGAAMFMGLFRSFIRVFSGQICLDKLALTPRNTTENCLTKAPEENQLEQTYGLGAVEITNNYIVKEHGETGMFATMFFGILDPKTGLMTYINGGHEPLIVANAGGIKETLAPTGPAVGMIPNAKFKIRTLQLEPGDSLIGYTDGVTEARSPSGEFFSYKRLVSLITESFSSPCKLLEQIKTDVVAHTDSAPQFDDITMLAVQWHSPKD